MSRKNSTIFKVYVQRDKVKNVGTCNYVWRPRTVKGAMIIHVAEQYVT